MWEDHSRWEVRFFYRNFSSIINQSPRNRIKMGPTSTAGLKSGPGLSASRAAAIANLNRQRGDNLDYVSHVIVDTSGNESDSSNRMSVYREGGSTAGESRGNVEEDDFTDEDWGLYSSCSSFTGSGSVSFKLENFDSVDSDSSDDDDESVTWLDENESGTYQKNQNQKARRAPLRPLGPQGEQHGAAVTLHQPQPQKIPLVDAAAAPIAIPCTASFLRARDAEISVGEQCQRRAWDMYRRIPKQVALRPSPDEELALESFAEFAHQREDERGASAAADLHKLGILSEREEILVFELEL